MKSEYRDWLERAEYDAGTVNAQVYRAERVEEFHGCLDQHYERDRCTSLIAQLTYSAEDQRCGRPNPSRIPFKGNVRNNLASYRNAVVRYVRFREVKGSLEAQRVVSPTQRVPKSVGPKSTASKMIFRPREGAKTLVDFGLDGRGALAAIIASSQYGTIAQAVASLTLFTHPDTVRQSEGRALFPSIRNQKRVGQIDEYQGRQVLLDDNKSPTDAFLWANCIAKRGPDTQFNHIYTASFDVEAYTALPNICMTPAFIAKLTDTSEQVRQLLKYRSYELYGWIPKGQEPPARPPDYEKLEWAAPLPAVADLRATLERAMASKPKNRTVLAARELGWLFAGPRLTPGT